MLSGRLLISDIDRSEVPAGKLACWWMGQHSFILKAGRTVMYIDPFLSDIPGRLVPPMLGPAEVTNAHLILGTHDHVDHIDRKAWPALAKASPRAKFIAPDLLRAALLRETGIASDRVIGMDDGQTVDVVGVKITAVASAHEFLEQDPATGKFPHLGYVIQAGGRIVYHSGDCCIYEGLITKLQGILGAAGAEKFDAMFLPINGRDAKRYLAGCLGNMTYQEAADLAGAVGTRLVIPAHWDMFAMNLGSPGDFADYVKAKYPGTPCRICRYGEGFVVG